MLKKQIILRKGLHIVKKKPIVLLYQFNNIGTKDWQLVKNEIKKIDEINALVIQNNVANEIIKRSDYNDLEFERLKKENQSLVTSKDLSPSTDSSLKNLFQGPTFILGCEKIEQLVLIYNLLKKTPGFLFIGGLYNNQNISHLTLEKLVKLNEKVKQSLFQFLDNKKIEIVLVNQYLLCSCLNFLQLLELSLQKQEFNSI